MIPAQLVAVAQARARWSSPKAFHAGRIAQQVGRECAKNRNAQFQKRNHAMPRVGLVMRAVARMPRSSNIPRSTARGGRDFIAS